MEIHLVLRLN